MDSTLKVHRLHTLGQVSRDVEFFFSVGCFALGQVSRAVSVGRLVIKLWSKYVQRHSQ